MMATRILLAEDNERLSSMLQSFLESLGHQVLPAGDGNAALAALEAGPVDLLILDLKLPGTSGVEVLQRVRKTPSLKTLPVIIMTGVYRGGQYAAAAEKLGVKAYLEKPFSREAFLEAVRSALQPAAPRWELVELLIELYFSRATGTLELSGGTRVTLLKGEPVSFVSGEFIPFLLATGHLAASDVETYLPHGASRLQLTEAGLMSYEELIEQSRLYLFKRLSEAIEAAQPVRFIPQQLAPELPVSPVSLPRVIYQAARSSAARFNSAAFLSRQGRSYPAKTAEYFRRINLLTLGRDDIDLLEYLSTGRRVEEIVAASADQNAAASFLSFLQRMGMITLNPAPVADQAADFPQKRLFNRPIEEVHEPDAAPLNFEDLVDEVSGSVELVVGEEGMAAPLSADEIDFEQEVQRDFAATQDKNYYEIFGLTQASFSFAALKEAYFSKTRQYSAEKFMELSGATLSRAQDVLAHYANAYNTLSNVVAKERYDEILNADQIGVGGQRDDELQARIQFQSGKVFLDMEDYPNAERALQDAYTLDPQDARTCAFLAWSIYKNPANSGSRASIDKCRMLLSKSLQMGRCAEAFSFRGWMLLDEGRDGLAESEFQKALKFNSRERLAQAGMRQITERREAEKKGLFKRIFG
jgi:DNA-binding response OmpR family regulator/tetratricopeptide (TPR) repeat protein